MGKHDGNRRILGPLVRPARSAILSIALCQPRSSLFHRLQHGLAVLGDLGRDVLLEIALGHRKLYGLTRTRQRFRCL